MHLRDDVNDRSILYKKKQTLEPKALLSTAHMPAYPLPVFLFSLRPHLVRVPSLIQSTTLHLLGSVDCWISQADSLVLPPTGRCIKLRDWQWQVLTRYERCRYRLLTSSPCNTLQRLCASRNGWWSYVKVIRTLWPHDTFWLIRYAFCNTFFFNFSAVDSRNIHILVVK
jgi:hypothetical protein